MNAKTEAVTAIVAAAAVAVVLDDACKEAASADRKAREAAVAAVKAAGAPVGEAGVHVAAILAAYAPHLANKTVKDSFSAAVAVLVSARPVIVCGTEIGERKGGALTVKAPEILAADEVAPDGKITRTLEPSAAVANLACDVLRRAAASARETMGYGRKAAGGGRPAKAQGVRAPFAEELAAQLGNAAGFLHLQAMLKPLGYTLVALEAPVPKKRVAKTK